MGRSPTGSEGQGGAATCGPLHPGAGAVLGRGQARRQVCVSLPSHLGGSGGRAGGGVCTEGAVASLGH